MCRGDIGRDGVNGTELCVVVILEKLGKMEYSYVSW